ncbi:galactose-6-phosphate isomerase subunit LacA [Alicyclobacillus contaminans]|nr:galactose-6-phosphate isomerase subunit LacA [Alicyclobacillus contaminans]
MKVVIGADKAGMGLKEYIKSYLLEEGYEVVDKSEQASVDFVESALAVSQELLKNEENLGIAIDAYGAGSFMAATKVKGIIAAEVSDERSAFMTREHNNCRLITLGSEITGRTLAKKL